MAVSKRTSRVLIVAVVVQLIGLLAAAGVTFLTDYSGSAGWLVGPAATLVAGVIVSMTGTAAEPFVDAQQPGRTAGARRSSGVAGALVVLVVLVVAGVGLALGVRYVVGYVTGNESGVSVLVADVSGKGSGLTATVEDVEYTEHFTRVDVVVRNGGSTSASLPLYGNVVLAAADGTTLEGDAFRSDWSTTLGPGATQRGTFVFPGRLPADATRASLSVATVFRQGPGSGALRVSGIRLDPARS